MEGVGVPDDDKVSDGTVTGCTLRGAVEGSVRSGEQKNLFRLVRKARTGRCGDGIGNLGLKFTLGDVRILVGDCLIPFDFNKASMS